MESKSNTNYSERALVLLKDVVKELLQGGFDRNSYTVQNHVRYIKRIQSADNPERFIKAVARRLFPNEMAYYEMVQRVHDRYTDNTALSASFDTLYAFYFEISQEKLERRNISATEAESILEELLI